MLRHDGTRAMSGNLDMGGFGVTNAAYFRFASGGWFDIGIADPYWWSPGAMTGEVIWWAGNDGTGSGLDADLLDGQDSTYWTNAAARVATNLSDVAAIAGLAPYTNHQTRTDNPHTVTLQQAVNAGGTATNVGAVTMVGDLTMGANAVSGQRFGEGAGIVASGTMIGAYGFNAGGGAKGDYWGAYGDQTGINAVHTNSHSFGRFAGMTARGNSRMYLDVYATEPSIAVDGATNDTIFMDSDGKLFLGGGPSRAENPSAGGELRGTWTGGGFVPSTPAGIAAAGGNTNNAGTLTGSAPLAVVTGALDQAGLTDTNLFALTPVYPLTVWYAARSNDYATFAPTGAVTFALSPAAAACPGYFHLTLTGAGAVTWSNTIKMATGFAQAVTNEITFKVRAPGVTPYMAVGVTNWL
jgi:hypothetical protein